MRGWRQIAVILVFATSAFAIRAASQGDAGMNLEVPGCGNLENAYGPYDYTNAANVRDKLPIVELHHFDAGVVALKGMEGSTANLGGDLDYTLRAFPNHHGALDAMGRYQLQLKQGPVPGAHYTAECYFERAMALAPDDGITRMVYGIYLIRKGDREGALERYLEAEKLMPDSAELNYNMGLLYTTLERYDDALEHAQKAYAGGFPLMGLKNKLIRAGVWRDPPPAPAPPANATEGATGGSEQATPAPASPGADSPPPATAPPAADSTSEQQ